MKIRETTEDLQVIGHRGAAGYAPENTLAAFQKGFELGANWVETDVQTTADGAYVLLHDAMVDRTTNGTGEVTQLSLKEIKSLDAGSWFDAQYRGLQVPTLEELLEWAKDKVGVCLDLHPKLGLNDMERIGVQISSFELARRSLAISSNIEILQYLKEICPELTTGILYQNISDEVLEQVARTHIDFLHPNRHTVDTGLIEKAHAMGLPVAASVFSDEQWIRERFEWGLDTFNCDHPDLPRKVLGCA